MAASLDNVSGIVQSPAPASRRLHAILGKPSPARIDLGAFLVEERAKRSAERLKAKREYARAWGRAHAEQYRTYARERYALLREDPEFRRRTAESRKRWAATKPLARRAQKLVQSRVRSGVMPSASELDCADCGRPATDYEHRDYTKPLEVVPTCRSCNLLRGPGYPYNQP